MIQDIVVSRETVDFIKKALKRGRAVALTGAGVSSESGIPVFRGKDGLWEKYDPDTFAEIGSLVSLFQSHPKKVADFIIDFYSLLLKAKPNSAHFALSAMEKEGILSSVITQNIDNLHQEAGSRSVIELHGNAYRLICRRCSKNYLLEKDRLKEMVNLFSLSRSSRIKLLKILSRYCPRCKCRGRFRLDIVLFGELLSQDLLAKAYEELVRGSLLFIIGTSGIIYPAAGLPLYAKNRGAKIIEINSEDSVLTSLSDYHVRGKAGDILTQIYSQL